MLKYLSTRIAHILIQQFYILDGNDKCEKHVESMGMRQVMFEMVTHSEEEFGVTGN